jgi:hypothetical protein
MISSLSGRGMLCAGCCQRRSRNVDIGEARYGQYRIVTYPLDRLRSLPWPPRSCRSPQFNRAALSARQPARATHATSCTPPFLTVQRTSAAERS